MKKLQILIAVFLSTTTSIFAQMAVTSIQNNQTELVVNDSIKIKKGSEIQIFLPVGKEFMFVKQKKSGFNAKLLSSVADIAGTGAGIIGMNTGNINVLRNATKVISTANTVRYSADMIDKIQDLPISNQAKKIAGKKMQIQDWTFTDNGYIITAVLDKKKYEIYLQEAALAGEVKL